MEEESCAHSSAHFHNTFRIPKGMRLDQRVLWRRYVDDLLCLSWAYCAYGMGKIMKATYTEQLSITHRTSLLDPQAPFAWTDFELRCTPAGWEVEADQRHSDLKVQELHLSKADFDDRECAEFIASLAENTTLTHLDMSHNLIGEICSRSFWDR